MKIQIVALATLLIGSINLGACDGAHHINGPVSIADGTETGDVSTVNGPVAIGAKAHVAGVHSVNGGLSLGEDSRATSMKTVNGSISLAERAEVTGNIETVNGALALAPGSKVGGELANINGGISVDGARVGGGLRTVNASIKLDHGATIDGGILMKKPHGTFVLSDSRPPRVVIGRDVTVNGTLRFEREVRLYVSDKAAHVGTIEGATPVTYQGDNPPE